MPPSWRAQFDDLLSDNKPKLDARDFLEFARETIFARADIALEALSQTKS